MARYTAYTLDGSPVKTADTAQQIADAVIEHTNAQRKPHIAYTFDETPGYVWPYTTWRFNASSNTWIGTPRKTYNEVADHVQGLTA